MITLRRGSIGLFAFISIGPSWAAERPTETIPFRLHRGHLIVVQGSIGGLKNRNFVIDTGASSTVINESVAKKLRLKAKARIGKAFGRDIQIKRVQVAEIRLGSSRHFQDVPALIGNLYFFHGIRIDALIGVDFLKKSNLGIDFDSGTITLGDLNHFGERMSFYSKAPYVLVRMKVAGAPLNLKLDSGAGKNLILYSDRVQGRIGWKKTDEIRIVKHMGGKVQAEKVLLSNVLMGETAWGELTALVLRRRNSTSGTLDGVVGLGALGLSSFRLDFDRGLISWEK